MRRRVAAAALVAAAVLCAPASAQTRALAPVERFGGPALGGDRVFWGTSSGDALSVRSAPVGGGAETVAGTVPLPRSGAPWFMAGAPEGLAVRVPGQDERLFAAPLGGPLTELDGSIERGPALAAEPRLWVTSAGVVSLERREAVIRTGPGAGRRLALPAGADPERFGAAGGLGAVAVRDAIVVFDLGTGAEVRRLPLDGDVIGLGISPEGDVAVTAEIIGGGDVLEWAPAGGGEFTQVARGESFGLVATAARRIAFVAPDTLHDGVRAIVVEPSAPLRVLYRGPAAFAINALAFDGRHVAFASSLCQLVARADPASSRLTVPAGPCARTDVKVTLDSPPLDAQGSYRVRIACVTAAVRRCRVSLRVSTFDGRLAGRASGRPRRGAHKLFRIRLNRRGLTAARKHAPELLLTVRATDPDGRSATLYEGIG